MSVLLQRNLQLTPSNSASMRRNNNAWNSSAALELKPNGLLLRPRPNDIVLRPSDNVSKPSDNVPKPRPRQRKLLGSAKVHRLKWSEPSKRLNRPDRNRCANVCSS